MIAALNDVNTAACVISERTLMSQLGGHCQAPIAAYAQLKSQKICLTSRVIDKYSGKVLEVSKYEEISKPKELGKLVAEELLSLGAQKIIVNALER